MPFAGADGVSRVVVRQVNDIQVPYWGVQPLDGDWEELNRREMTTRLRDVGAHTTSDEVSRRQRAQSGMGSRLQQKTRLTAGMPSLG